MIMIKYHDYKYDVGDNENGNIQMTMVMINEEVIQLNSNTIEFLFKNSRLRPCLRGVEVPVLVG